MYKTILVPLDGSQLAHCVLAHLESLTEGGKVDRVVLLQAVEPLPMAFGEDYALSQDVWTRLEAEHIREAETHLAKVAEGLKGIGVEVRCDVQVGRAADVIADYAEKHGVDLILMATHGRSGVSRWVMGSVADRVVRTSCTPVLLVRPPECKV